MKISYLKLQNLIKLKFRNLNLLKKSLTHKSYDAVNNYEKLEFLGDRVLGLVLSKTLLEIYSNDKEGVIDKKFANLVNKKTCTTIANQLNLKKFIKTGNSFKKVKSTDEKILSDCCEALIGAIYLDQGLVISEKFILSNWENFIKNSKITQIDPKTKLQEHSLKKFKKLPIYKTIKKTGPNHNPFFQVTVQIENSKKYIGQGNSKKNAEQNAAFKLIRNLNI